METRELNTSHSISGYFKAYQNCEVSLSTVRQPNHLQFVINYHGFSSIVQFPLRN